MSSDSEITRDAGSPPGVDELIVRSGQGGGNRRFHLPSDDEGTETLCDRATRSSNLYRKPCNVYPDGWLEWCDGCLGRYEGPDE